uniref:hypothetical protein n=1 Tax=Alloprevotella sp. TaxID=1872471 RepID=UPI003FF092D2
SRPQPWQGCALPTELFPQRFITLALKCGAKVQLFSVLPNFHVKKIKIWLFKVSYKVLFKRIIRQSYPIRG